MWQRCVWGHFYIFWYKTVIINHGRCTFLCICAVSLLKSTFPKAKRIRIQTYGEITVKHMFVWHNKSGISPKSCSNLSLHSWELRSCSHVYVPGAQRRGVGGAAHWSGFSDALRDQLAGDQSPCVIGDQSVAWCRVSIAEGLTGLLRVFPPHCSSCVSASALVHVCVCRLLLGRRWGKKARSFLRPEWETD